MKNSILNEKSVDAFIIIAITLENWQNPGSTEGNARTTAIFLIKYLRKLGFREVNNNLFAHLRGFSEIPL